VRVVEDEVVVADSAYSAPLYCVTTGLGALDVLLVLSFQPARIRQRRREQTSWTDGLVG